MLDTDNCILSSQCLDRTNLERIIFSQVNHVLRDRSLPTNTKMTSVMSAMKESIAGVSDTKKIKDLRHNIRDPHGAEANERMRTDHGTKIADPENW